MRARARKGRATSVGGRAVGPGWGSKERRGTCGSNWGRASGASGRVTGAEAKEADEEERVPAISCVASTTRVNKTKRTRESTNLDGLCFGELVGRVRTPLALVTME